MQIITGIEQGTPEWHGYRLGIVGMSRLECLLVNGKGEGGFGAGAFTYMHELIGERFTGKPTESFSTAATERGHTDEPVACELYEIVNDVTVEHATIILNHGVGYSPDGLVGGGGLLEIKSKKAALQVEILLDGEIPKMHYAQCQGGLWVSEREHIDFMSYCEGMPHFIKRMYRDEERIRFIAQRVKDFYEILEERMAKITY